MKSVIGKCSRCGGEVVVEHPSTTEGVNVVKPQCCQCGAIKKEVLPVIEMEEVKQQLLQE